MAIFGLIAEGKTDQIIIENILVGYFNTDTITINLLSPPRDKTGRYFDQNYTNWLKVFEYCQSSEFKDAFQYNDYIIIQIDTDVSEEKHYDIPKIENGIELSPEQLIEKVVAKFKNLIGEAFYATHIDRIIFAISVHSVECWLLPLYYKDNKKSKIKNCLRALNQALAKKEGFTIDAKDPEYYEII
jgi:hypothetical protein